MRRIYPAHVYSDAPRAQCFWDTTIDIAPSERLTESLQADVAIMGAGFTGLNAAIALAEAGASVVILDAREPGWGASGRNGGFCCLGGSKATDAQLDRRLGKDARLELRQAEVAAVAQVENFLKTTGTDADVHSDGETLVAHRPRDAEGFDAELASVEENYGVRAHVLGKADLSKKGMNGPFHGALTIPIGFALNPRKYLAGLVAHAANLGVRIYAQAPVEDLHRHNQKWRAKSGDHVVSAPNFLVATNGYSSETIPAWLSGRYMPVQSSVAVSRPLTDAELEDQGWTSQQMCYDTRHLLHYFHLMPDRRMLFGMRGGLLGRPAADARAYARIERDFRAMFAAWTHVELTHFWSGMVCMSRNLTPFVGAVPDAPGLFGAMCYHGNGVAMASYSGRLVGNLIARGVKPPIAMQTPLRRFPLGPFRRALMPPAYLGLAIKDR